MPLATKADYPRLLEKLRRSGSRHAWAIQDLVVWPERSQFFYQVEGPALHYVLATGHPASQGHPTLIARGEPEAVATLLKEANLQAPLVIRETPATLLGVIKDFYPSGKVFEELYMAVSKSSFRTPPQGKTRKLSVADAVALAQFYGAPPQAAPKFQGWLAGAKAFLGIFEGERLVAIGSSMISVPEAWYLVSINTHPDFRRKGLGLELTSALVARAFEETDCVSLTVLKGNAPAIALYQKMGFAPVEETIWVDCGAGSSPS